MRKPAKTRPFDGILRARLHLPEDAHLRLGLIRSALNMTDTLSRLALGKPFFALKEAETLLQQLDGKRGLDLIRDLMGRNGGTRIVAQGLENVPNTGPVVIASTHSTGMFDFVAHAAALAEKRPDVKVVANEEAARFLGSEIIVSVRISKENQALSAKATLAAMREHLDGGGALLIFGSGRVPERLDGYLSEPGWRNGTTSISKSCMAPIVPAAVKAENSTYYYRMRATAKWLSRGDDNTAARFASLRYVAELLEKLGGTYHVHYAPPVPPGSSPELLKRSAESLVPGLYKTSSVPK